MLGYADVLIGQGASGDRRFVGSCAGVVGMVGGYAVGVCGVGVEGAKAVWVVGERWRRRRRRRGKERRGWVGGGGGSVGLVEGEEGL